MGDRRQLVRFFGPVLRAPANLGGEARASEVRSRVAEDLKISERQQHEMMGGGSFRFGNQIAWARFYLAKAELMDSPRRGVWRLTDKGRARVRMTEDESVELARRIQSEVKGRKFRASSSADVQA